MTTQPAIRILILNGSVRGHHSNSGALAAHALRYLDRQPDTAVTVLTLTDPMPL